MRQRHALYLSEAMTQKLQLTAETHRVSKSEILERALHQYLTPCDGSLASDLLALSQQQNARSLARLERDLAIVTELMATFVRYFVTITPPMPMAEREAAWALGALRFNQVIEEVAKRLRTDQSLIARVINTLEQGPPTMPTDKPGQDDSHEPTASQSVPRARTETEGDG